jgi:GxxExxY protein
MLINPAEFDYITGPVIGAAIEVHRHLGAGLLESVYMQCLEFELTTRRIRFHTQRPVPLVYKDITLNASYRIDLVVEDRVLVEVKAVEAVLPIHRAQLMTYLRLANCPVGLVLNFNVPVLSEGVKRVLNPSAATSSVARGRDPA